MRRRENLSYLQVIERGRWAYYHAYIAFSHHRKRVRNKLIVIPCRHRKTMRRAYRLFVSHISVSCRYICEIKSFFFFGMIFLVNLHIHAFSELRGNLESAFHLRKHRGVFHYAPLPFSRRKKTD